jgi:arginine decarboxylase
MNEMIQEDILYFNAETKGLVIGNRIPMEYFVTVGKGESDISVHAGSFHLALKSAGIEMANIITYSSILPAIAKEVEKPAHIDHGCVMESIMSHAQGNAGERVSAGIIYGWLYNKYSGEKFGGLVAEQQGNYEMGELKQKLTASLHEIYMNGFEDKYEMSDLQIYTDSFVPRKKFGSMIIALCFTNYFYPVKK